MTTSRSSTLVLSLFVSFASAFVAGCGLVRADPSTEPSPQLCDLDGGRWCSECVGAECTEGSAGWLCCSGGVCVPVNEYADCTLGVCGWCNDYSTETTPNGNTVATCHD